MDGTRQGVPNTGTRFSVHARNSQRHGLGRGSRGGQPANSHIGIFNWQIRPFYKGQLQPVMGTTEPHPPVTDFRYCPYARNPGICNKSSCMFCWLRLCTSG